MEINRNNYQLWITDFFDGNLKQSQENELMQFLRENPDLASEFEFFGTTQLYPDISVRINKKALKRDYSQLTDNQKEELLIALYEEKLPGEDANEILSFVDKENLLAETSPLLSGIRLKPENIVFPDKIKLKRIPRRHTFRKITSSGLAAAASLAILLSLWFLTHKNDPLSIPVGNTAVLQALTHTDESKSSDDANADNKELAPANTVSNNLRADAVGPGGSASPLFPSLRMEG